MRFIIWLVGAALVSVQLINGSFNSLTLIGWGLVTVSSLVIVKKMKGIENE